MEYRKMNVNLFGRSIYSGPAKIHSKEDVREKFEKAYGQDSDSRTPEQWRRLVKVYGIDTVMMKDSMTADQVINRCHESYASYLNRQFKNKKR